MTGDQQDVFRRIKTLIPPWFSDVSPYLDSLIQSFAYTGSFVYSLYEYAKLQTRIKTATDGWLDLISADFFGSALPRKANQSDVSFRNRIIVNLFRERATRGGVVRVLQDLTGRTPKIFEPLNINDTGAYGAPNSGYGVYGGYGSLLLAYQAFVTAYRPIGTGVPNVSGYGARLPGTGYPFGGGFIPEPATPAPGGYGSGQIEYASMSMMLQVVSDEEIYEAIDSVAPAGTIAWTSIQS